MKKILISEKVFDKTIFEQKWFNDKNIPDDTKIVEIEECYFIDCVKADFNEDLTFNVEKYNARKEKEKAVEYENKIVALIRERYNVNQELAILRQKDTKTEEYNEYYAYVEECKAKVKNGGV